MGIEELEQFEIVQGALSLIYALGSIVIGLIITVRYFSYKRVELLGVGTLLALASSPWLAGGISFLTFIFFDFILSDPVYLFINYGFVGLAITLYVHAITSLIYPNSLKKIVSIFLSIAIIFEVILIYLLFTNINEVGHKEGKFDSAAGNIPILFILFVLISTLIFTTLFIRVCLKSPDRINHWRGKLLLIAIILMVIGSFLDVVSSTITTLFIARILLISRLFFAYTGWLMPAWAARWQKDHGLSEESEELNDEVHEFLKILSQRRDVTAKEVTVYREKKICLVCKGKVGGFNNYICTKCEALYCEKCARALTRLENACWACNEAIDKSQPVRQIESEQEAIELIKLTEDKKKPKKKVK